MSQNQSSKVPLNSSPMNVILGGAGIGLLLSAAGVAYVRSQKQAGSKMSNVFENAKSGRPSMRFNPRGKWALSTFIRVIEHDSSRKVLLAMLKAMAKRAK